MLSELVRDATWWHGGDAIADGPTTEQATGANGTLGCHAAIRAAHKLRAKTWLAKTWPTALVQAVERLRWTTVMGQAPHADRAAITTPTPFAA